MIKSGCGLSSWKRGQECPRNPQAGKPALRDVAQTFLSAGSGDFPVACPSPTFNHTHDVLMERPHSPGKGIFALSLTRDVHFRTVFRFHPRKLQGNAPGTRRKPLWHRCCLDPQQDRSSPFRLSKKHSLMKPKSSLLWSILTFNSAAVIHASGEAFRFMRFPPSAASPVVARHLIRCGTFVDNVYD